MHLFARIQMRRAAVAVFSLAPDPALVPFALLRTNRHARTLARSSHGRLTRAHARNVHAARRDTRRRSLTRFQNFYRFYTSFPTRIFRFTENINRSSIRTVLKLLAQLP